MRRVGTLLCLLILPGLILAAAATRDHSIQPAEQAPSPAPQAALAPIPWRSGAASATAKNPSQIHNALTALVAPPGPLRGAPAPQHVVVQFDRPPAPARRAALHNHGITLLAPLGGNAFFAAVSPARLNPQALTDLTSLKDVRPIDPLRKLHPLLPAAQAPSWALLPAEPETEPDDDAPPVAAYVLFHRDVQLNPDAINVALQHGAVVRSLLHSVNGLVLELPFSSIPPLVREDTVQWVEPPLPPLSPANDAVRAATGADIVHAPPYDLDGAGVTVLVYDDGKALASHLDFSGRLHTRDLSSTSSHATHVAGTIGGDGTMSAGLYAGLAPAVSIQSYGFQRTGSGSSLYTNPGDLEQDYDEALNLYGADLANNSINSNACSNALPCEVIGDYGVTAALIDAIVRGSLGAPFPSVWANGN